MKLVAVLLLLLSTNALSCSNALGAYEYDGEDAERFFKTVLKSKYVFVAKIISVEVSKDSDDREIFDYTFQLNRAIKRDTKDFDLLRSYQTGWSCDTKFHLGQEYLFSLNSNDIHFSNSMSIFSFKVNGFEKLIDGLENWYNKNFIVDSAKNASQNK